MGFKVGHPKSKVVYFHMEGRVKKLIFIVSNLTKMQNLNSFRYFQGWIGNFKFDSGPKSEDFNMQR